MTGRSGHRVLVLAYFFPPLAGGGVQRTLKHVRYLPYEGFEPIVVTTRLGWSPTRDPTLAAEVPGGTLVIRAREFPLQVMKWGLHGLLRRANIPTDATAYIGWPDEMAGWVPGATWQTLRAIRRYRPDVLYSTSSPVSAHLVALIASRATAIPWVADFRDAWTQNPQGERVGRAIHGLSARLERAVVAQARYLTVVDESVELLGIDQQDPRFVVIRNGVDPEDLPPATSYTPAARFRISYVGALYGERNAAPVFKALRALVARGVVDEAKLEVRLVGHLAPETDLNFERLPVCQVGYVDHGTAISEMAAADVLLFYAPAINRGSSGKIYEYLVSGRPILCVAGRDNFASRLVEELGAGRCAEPDNQSAIEDAIERLYRRWNEGELTISPAVRAEALRRFSRPALARELASVLSSAAALGDPLPASAGQPSAASSSADAGRVEPPDGEPPRWY
jgi:glycosyltransferase involved in cell wall biosynthesis